MAVATLVEEVEEGARQTEEKAMERPKKMTRAKAAAIKIVGVAEVVAEDARWEAIVRGWGRRGRQLLAAPNGPQESVAESVGL